MRALREIAIGLLAMAALLAVLMVPVAATYVWGYEPVLWTLLALLAVAVARLVGWEIMRGR